MPSIEFYRKLCDSSFWHFARIMSAAALKEKYSDISPTIHKTLCNFFQDTSIKRKAIFEPRNWLKSTVFTCLGSVWRYLKNNNIRILIASQNDDIAKRFLWFIQHQLMNNKLLRKIYPELEPINREWKFAHRWSTKYIECPRSISHKETTITSIGVGGAAQSGHYDLIFIDDPVGKKHIDSPIELEKVLRWQDNVPELLDNPNFEMANASEIVIACTFWGPGDYGNYVMEKCPEYQWRIVPCLKDETLEDSDHVKYVQDPEADHMTSNWEGAPDGKSTTEYYLNMMSDPELQSKFWSQHMNNPKKAPGLTKFDESWLRYYHFEERDQGAYVVCDDDKEEYSVRQMPKHGMIDPGGFSETKLMKKGSRNAVMIGGQPNGTIKKFILYTWAGKLRKPSEFIETVFSAHAKFNPHSWKIETIGAQEYMRRDLMEQARKQHLHFPISSCPSDNSENAKTDRISALIQPFSNGEIYIHHSMKEFIGEYINYPGGLTRDLLDCAGWLFQMFWLRRPRPERDSGKKLAVLNNRDSVTGY